MSQAATDTPDALKTEIAALESKGKFHEAAPLKAKLASTPSAAPEPDRDQTISQLRNAIADHESKGEYAAAGRAKVALALMQSR